MSNVFRVMPALNGEQDHFWTGGKDGELRIARCQACEYWIHPAAPICPKCHSREIQPEVASGNGVVHTFTVNHHSWDGSTEPWVIALVELVEQVGLRLTTNLVGIGPDEVAIDMPVQVTFEDHDPVWFPVFEAAS